MAKNDTDPPDERFHFKIWSGRSIAMNERDPSIYYCENHNADIDYEIAALDFEMAAEALISVQRAQPSMGNWTAPLLHLVRQAVELKLKSLVQTIGWKSETSLGPVKFDHNLEGLWATGRIWLIENGYHLGLDARLQNTDRLIENLHAIDPTGDLFRFGTSRMLAFGRNKSSDRVGVHQERFFVEFGDTMGCLNHWIAVIMREIIKVDQGWDEDPYFDKDAFPKTDTGN